MTNSPDLVQSLARRVLESKKNLNDILKIQNILSNPGNDDITTCSATHALLMIFEKFIREDQMKTAGIPETDARHVAATWIRAQYQKFTASLIAFVSSDSVSDRVKIAAIRAYMDLVKAESVQKAARDGEYSFARDLYASLFSSCLKTPSSLTLLLNLYIQQFDDIRYYSLKEITRLCSLDNSLVQPIFQVMIEVKPFETGEEKEEGSTKGKLFVEWKRSKVSALSRKAQKKASSDAWLAFLRLPLTNEMYKDVLSIVNETIIPNLNDPRLLHDFLTDCYNQGGALSLLALQGLFSLIHRFNLDYPDFYVKLYALFDHTVLHMKYRAKFLKLADIFLKSSHLPAYLVAAFIKRMLRLCLTAPIGSIVATLPIVHNLLRRHPSCHVLVHRELEYLSGENEAPAQDSSNADGLLSDPYDFDEPDPSKCKALESSLWELLALKDHFHPKVAEIVKKFRIVFGKNQFPFDVEQHLCANYDSIIDEDLSNRKSKIPRLAYEKPSGSFYVPGGLVEKSFA